jgi:nanoRNase/pAp phosphatase (c-di-AMP/oligoRNAs hydrolase)
LEAGASVRYFDHHYAGEVPQHENLESYLDPSANVCTSLLVDRFLEGDHRTWAIVGAFGDNLDQEARALADAMGFDARATLVLQELGVRLNYNAYGESIADLHIAPAILAEQMRPCVDPLEFARSAEAYATLSEGYREDMQKARRLAAARAAPGALLFLLPDEAWARRASGVLANELLQAHPATAIAIVSPKTHGGYMVSVRVPRDAVVSADAFCRKFASGGGRRTAAGINLLPASDLDQFSKEFEKQFRSG